MERKTFDALKLVPPTPPCMDCRRKSVYGTNWHCYRDCSKWIKYADEYKEFVKKRDEIKRLRCHG